MNKPIEGPDNWISVVRKHFSAIADEDKIYQKKTTFRGTLIEATDESESGHEMAEKAFIAHLGSCSTIEVLMLGPATNFVHYATLLHSRLSRIVVEMRLIPGKLIGFNCEYDEDSCMQLGFFALQTRIEFATTPSGPIVPTCDFIVAFRNSPVGNALVRLHRMEPSWSDNSIQLWDDAAALYLVGLVPFSVNTDGMHVPDPRLPPEWFRQVEEMSITRSMTVQETAGDKACSLPPE